MSQELDIGISEGKKFTLPRDAVTQTFAILAKRGVGKTATAVVIVEELIGAGMPVVILDPLDCWYGLRSSADGKKEGLPVVVIGGERGDLPLNAADGPLIADFLVDHAANVVLSLRHLSQTGARTFVAGFLEALYHRKGENKNRTPLHLVIDEADAFCPQRLSPETARCFGAVDVIVRRGRSSGMGVTLISQRSAAVNKDCLTQAECMIALRTLSPLDRKAIELWIDAHDPDAQHDEFMKSLASLPVGTAWFWSPGWLGSFKKVAVRRRHTFDSSATPKIGDKIVEPTKVAAVDLEGLRKKLATTIEQKKADDPKELRKKIAQLEMDLRKAQSTPAPTKVAPPLITYKHVEKAFLMGYDHAIKNIKVSIGTCFPIDEVPDGISLGVPKPGDLKIVHQGLGKLGYEPVVQTQYPFRERIAKPSRLPDARQYIERKHAENRSGLDRCQRAIMTALAQYPEGRTKTQIALLSGYSGNSGGFNNALSKLRSAGFIDGRGERTGATPAGLEALGDYESLPPAGRDLLLHWIGKVDRCQRAILECLAETSDPQTKEFIADKTRYSENSGGFNNALSKLRTLELIEGRGEISLHPLLIG